MNAPNATDAGAAAVARIARVVRNAIADTEDVERIRRTLKMFVRIPSPPPFAEVARRHCESNDFKFASTSASFRPDALK